MRRKINLVGQSTLTISLPSKWVKDQSLKKGDELEITVNNNQLYLSKEGEPTSSLKEIEINLSEADQRIVRSILGAYYQKGYDIMRVHFVNDKIFKFIKEAVANLIGFEIVERTASNCVIKSYLMEAPEELDSAISKMINITKTIQKMAREDYERNDYSRYEEMEEYRFSGWKLRDLSMRIISDGNKTGGNKHEYQMLLWTLEKINRNYKRMYLAMKENNLKKDQPVLDFYDAVTRFYDFMSKSIMKKDLKSSEFLYKEHDRLVSCAFELLPVAKKNAIVISYLLENVRRIQDMASPIIMINY